MKKVPISMFKTLFMAAAVVVSIGATILIVSHLPLSKTYAQTAIMATKTKKVTLIADEKILQLAPPNPLFPGGVLYKAMTFNGTIPGPVIALDEGERLQITLKNEGHIVHSLELHAADGPSQAISGVVNSGESKTWTMKADTAGVFMYHCDGDNLNGIWEHIADGMYGGIVVHSPYEKPAKEFYMVFGEIYNSADQGLFVGTKGQIGSFDFNKFIANRPDLVLTNGMAFKYLPSIGRLSKMEINSNATLFKVKPGELTRWYIVNAGPRGYVAFNFAGGMINLNSGSVNNSAPTSGTEYGTQLKTYETTGIPPGAGVVIETVFPEQGVYVGNDHDIGRFMMGAGFVVIATNNSTNTDFPYGTWVPPKGSNFVSGSQYARATKLN
jgi:nitrite reductase (NO-forming)